MRPFRASPLLVLVVLGCSESAPTRPIALDAAPDITTPSPDDAASFDASFEVGLFDAPSGPPAGPRDRAGRALVAKLLVSSANRDAFAQLPHPFETKYDDGAKGAGSSIGEDIEARLSSLDALDGKTDWPAVSGSHPLLNVMLYDGLVVDPDLPFSPNGYLDFEENGAARTTCGGRYPSDDAIDKMLSFVITGARSGVGDGVAAPASAPSLTFPYLAPPK